MESRLRDYAESGSARNAITERRSEHTGLLLLCGVIAGPIYLTLGIGQGLLREGFDFGRHALSHLANGPGGWVQTVNFAITGLLVVAAAVGLGRALAPRPRAFVWTLSVYGIAMIAAALFRADPIDGFPPGTPIGMPESVSTTGLLHFIAGAVAFLFLGTSCIVAARVMQRRQRHGLAVASLLAGITVLAGFFGGMAVPGGIYGIWLAVAVGWVWLAAISLHARSNLTG